MQSETRRIWKMKLMSSNVRLEFFLKNTKNGP